MEGGSEDFEPRAGGSSEPGTSAEPPVGSRFGAPYAEAPPAEEPPVEEPRPEAPRPEPVPVPWETARSFDRIEALFVTVWRVVSNPNAFFSRLSSDGKGHFSFAWLLFLFTGYVQLFYEAFFIALRTSLFGGLESEPSSSIRPVSMLIVTGIFLPALVAGALVLEAALNHAMLLFLGQARERFGATLRAKCYGVAPILLSVIPLFGAVVSWVAVMVTSVVALRWMHRTSWWTAIFAYFMPLILAFAFVVFLFGLLLFVGALRGFTG